MAKVYKRYGATTDGYRGERALLKERVVEGLEKISFTDNTYQLTATSPQTIYLDSSNMAAGNKIILPNAQDLWPNWKVSVINESTSTVNIYYYRSNENEDLALFKEVTGGNMTTCILLDDTTEIGTWTTLRTVDQTTIDLLDRYTSDVYEEIDFSFGQLQQDTTSLTVSLGTVMTGCPLKSTFIKTSESFAGVSGLQVSIGTAVDHTRFSQPYDLTAAVSDTNFTKDIYDDILSTSADTEIFAYFTGSNSFQSLTAGFVKIIVEKAKLIDPTILRNPIVQTQVPIGVIMNYAFTDTPEGYIRLDGSLWPNAAASIPQFVKKLNEINNKMTSANKLIISESEWNSINNTYGSCGKFAWIGSALRFPKITGFVRGLVDLNNLGKCVLDGLPNITGYIDANYDGRTSGASNSAIYSTTAPSSNGRGSTSGGNTRIYFNASRSNTVYGRSNEVQPKHVLYPYIISVYNKIQNASEIVLDEIIEDSVNKANTSLNNLLDTGLSTIRGTVISAFSRSGNGYIKLQPNSGVPIIIQWGSFTSNYDTRRTISLPTPFTALTYRIAMQNYNAGVASTGQNQMATTIYQQTTTSFSFYLQRVDNRSVSTSQVTHWIAIGY